MQELIIHLLKSAGLLSLFFACYFFLLKNDTNFKSTRYFLLAGILTSVLLPFLKITRTIAVESATSPINMENFSGISTAVIPANSAGIDWWQITGTIYLIGLSFFLLKFFVEFFFLLKLFYTHEAINGDGFSVIHKKGNLHPFSFFRFIVLDPNQHSPAEQEMILEHERAHGLQWHSVDQILTSLCVYLLWFNPLAWLYRRSVVQNLEFLADKEVIKAEVSKKEYQKTLLKISVASLRPALTNQFYQSFIKKRIIMLNKNTSQKSPFWKVSVVLPFLAGFIFIFNVRAEARELPQQHQSVITKTEVSAYVTKDSEEKELRGFERLFLTQGVELKFGNLQYSDDLLTNLSLSYEDVQGVSGSMFLNDPNGISPLLIFTDGSKVILTPNVASSVKAENPLAEVGNSPLYIIAGKEYKQKELVGKKIWIKKSYQILNAAEASKKYGRKAKDGAIVISKGEIIEDYGAHLREMDEKLLMVNRDYLWVRKKQRPIVIRMSKETNSPSNALSSRSQLPNVSSNIKSDSQEEHSMLQKIGKNPLYVIGDREYTASELSGKYVRVTGGMSSLTPAEGKIKYGEKAKDGVFIISEGEIGEDLQKEMKRIDREEIDLWAHYLEIWENKKPSLITVDKTSTGAGNTNYFKQTGAKAVPVDREGKPVDKKFKVQKAEYKYISDDINASQEDNKKTIIYNNQQSIPLVIVEGEEKNKDFDVSSIDPSEIKSVNVLKGTSATENYGDKGKDGVIEIDLKSEEEMKEKGTSEERKKPLSITIGTGKFENSTAAGSTTISVRDVGSANSLPKDVLYIVNGKAMAKDFKSESIPADKIEAITVLRGEQATNKYGKKAKNGVVEITLKEE